MRPPPITFKLSAAVCPPPEKLLPAFAARPGCVFLDSALPSPAARHSILACEPSLVLRGGDEALDQLRSELAARACAPVAGLPFVGGAIGYLGYEFGASKDRVPAAAPDDTGLPDLAFGLYDSALVHDHHTGETTLVAPDAAALSRIRDLVDTAIANDAVRAHAKADHDTRPAAPAFSVGPLAPDLTPETYSAAIARIRDYIASGDVYQVNFTHRFGASFSGSAATLHLRLRELSPAPHAAFLDFGDFQLVSSTPERLLSVRGRELETRPIKGTIARLTDIDADARNRAALLASAKDQAELLMIVDLARNDLGRVSIPGSVHVAERHRLESYATVHHLVATVRGRLADGLDRFDALRALHPGGSITGAPKIRAMQIISELETSRRHAYTGALGYLGYDGDADLAIAIRTITCARGRATYHVGGGITWDSAATAEYDETLHKGRAMHRALQTPA